MKWYVGIVMFYIIFAFFVATGQNSYGVDSNQLNNIQVLMNPSIVTSGGFGIFSIPGAWLHALWNVLSFNYDFNNALWDMIHWMIIIPILIGSLLYLFFLGLGKVSLSQ